MKKTLRAPVALPLVLSRLSGILPGFLQVVFQITPGFLQILSRCMCGCARFPPCFARLLPDLTTGITQILFHFRGSFARLLVVALRAGCRDDRE
jgi:hypothetical protein